MKQQFPQGKYPNIEEMTHFVLTQLLKSWTDYFHGCPTWSILQRPCVQCADVYANPEQETPQKVFSRSPGRLCSPLRSCLGCEGKDLPVGGTKEKDAVEVHYYLFIGNFLMKAKKKKKSLCLLLYSHFLFILGFEKEVIIYVSSSFLPSLLFLSFSPSVPKIRRQRDGWQMFIGKRRLTLSSFLSLFNSIALNNVCNCVKMAT